MTLYLTSFVFSIIKRRCEELSLLRSHMILDIHTHTLPLQPGTAIVSVNAEEWHPFPGHWYAVGIHPWNIIDDGQEQLEHLRTVLSTDAFGQIRMLGEMGLDKRQGPAMEIQRKVFVEQLKIAHSIGKNTVIHDVRSMAELLAVRRELRCTQPWLIHGFRGGPEQARQYLRAGCHLSLGIRHNPDTLLSLPLHELFFESDEDPDSLKTLYDKAAQCLNISVEVLKSQVNNNVLHLLNS